MAHFTISRAKLKDRVSKGDQSGDRVKYKIHQSVLANTILSIRMLATASIPGEFKIGRVATLVRRLYKGLVNQHLFHTAEMVMLKAMPDPNIALWEIGLEMGPNLARPL